MSDAELALLRRHSFREGEIVDVGANLGLFSLVIRGRFPDRRLPDIQYTRSVHSLVKPLKRGGQT